MLAADPSCAYEPQGGAVIEPQRDGDLRPGLRRPRWRGAAGARARLDRIPSFVRGVVAKRVEDYARERGLHEITLELLGEVRSAMPIDFSQRRPFFVSETDG